MAPLGGTSGAFHVKHEGLTSAAGEVGLTLTGEQVARILFLEALLAERASDLGLVSEGDLPRIRERHVVDSFEAAAQVNQEDRLGVDLGSGGGLPGLVVAITRPELPMRLVESRRTRGAFLELAVEKLGLSNTSVVIARIEQLAERADVCFARAFGDAVSSWAAAQRILQPEGRLIYFAGEAFDPTRDLPEGVSWRLVRRRPVARAGPLVIMSRL